MGNKGGIDNEKKSRQKLKRRRQGNEGALSDKQWANYRVTGRFDPITVIIILVRGNTLAEFSFEKYFKLFDVNCLARLFQASFSRALIPSIK